jgi:stearoyl-CoA desaturase (Delta-9 desaturase)
VDEAAPLGGSGTRDDVQPVANQKLHRVATGLITLLPFVGLGLAGWQMWNSWLHWYDLIAFLAVYIPTGLGITVGFHRLFTHRSFKTGPATRFVLAALGSAAIEGPVVAWVADHRKHHAFSDEEGDPHSPHVDHGGLRGLFHAHVGWLFLHDQRALKTRYAPDLLADPVVSFVNRTFVLWVLAGFVAPFAIGFVLGGTVVGGLTSLLWGGLIRMFVLHHVTYSINSLCHVFGRRDFETGDESRNLAWLALPSFGESWHNNHHAFPTSSVHGLKWWQVDLSSIVIRALERLGLAWDVVRYSPAGARL